MAGLAALMTRKKRDRRRELEMKLQQIQDPIALSELKGKEAEEAMRMKEAHETIKKMLIGKELLHQKSKSFDAMSQISYQENDDDLDKDDAGNAYNAIYIGLVFVCIGVVITFVGLGEKGFKTLELKLIGPVLCLFGLSCIIFKVIQCTFPQLFLYPASLLRRRKLGDKEKASLMEKGESSKPVSVARKKRSSQEGNDRVEEHNPEEYEGEILSPRVTLQSAKRPQTTRPRSTIPNYIEESSDEDDDFNPKRNWKSGEEKAGESQQMPQIHEMKKSSEPPQNSEQSTNKKGEVVLNPKALKL